MHNMNLPQVFTGDGPYDIIFRLRHSLAIAFVALVTFTAGDVGAEPKKPQQPPEQRAQALAKAGLERAAAGDYQSALVMFKRALALHERSDIQCNVGGAYYKLKRWTEAHLYLGMCLSRTADLNDAAFVKAMSGVYANTEKQLRNGEFAPVRFRVTPTTAKIRVSAMPGDVSFTAPRTVWLPSGTHRVDARATDHVDGSTSVSVSKGKQATVTLSLKKKSSPVVIAPPTPAPQRSKTSGWITLSLGGAALAAGGVYYFVARKAANDAEGLSPDSSQYKKLKDSFEFRRLMSYSLLGAGTVVSAIGSYLLFRSAKKTERKSIGAMVTGERALVWARFQL